MALTSWTAMASAIKNKAQNALWWVKGEGESEIYALEVDPATGRLPVDAIVSFGYDTDWGIVGTDTLRTAAQIGNDLGQADFDKGAMTSQTLRVAVATDCTVAVSGTERPADRFDAVVRDHRVIGLGKCASHTHSQESFGIKQKWGHGLAHAGQGREF